MTRVERDRLLDIREALDRIAGHVGHDAVDEELLHDALVYQLLVIGEAVKHLDTEDVGGRPVFPGRRSLGCAT